MYVCVWICRELVEQSCRARPLFISLFYFSYQCGNTAITALSKKCFQLTSFFHSFLGVKVFKDCLHITIYPPWQRPGHSKPHLTDIITSLPFPPANLAPLLAQTQNFSEMWLVRLAKPLMESVYGRSSSFITFRNQLPSVLR